MNGHDMDMAPDPEAEQAMADLWAEWEYYSAGRHRMAKSAKPDRAWAKWLVAVGVVAAWFAAAEAIHYLLTK